MGLKALEQFLKKNPEHFYSIRFVCSPNEELGSIGFLNLFKDLGENSKYLFGLEPADKNGGIIHSRSGNRWYQFKIHGKSAHAGRFGENYINASHELTRIIHSMLHFNDEENMTRVNFGAMRTDFDSYNTICGGIEAKLDMRFNCELKRNNMHAHLERILEEKVETCPYSGEKPKTFYSIEDDCPPLSDSLSNLKLAKKLLNFIQENEDNSCISSIHSGGAADINYFANSDNSGIDGLGPISGKLHTNDEYIETYSLITRYQSLLALHIDIDQEGSNEADFSMH